MEQGLFATAINCMDGRVEEPVIGHLDSVIEEIAATGNAAELRAGMGEAL